MIGIVELNDAGLLVAASGGELLESPGYLAFEGKQLVVGTAAAEKVKLIPAQTQYAFWENLASSTPPTGQLPQSGLTHADLAYRHLEWLWGIVGKELKQLVICVPADWQRDELALLLGICQSLKIPVRALVNTALAASTHPQPGQRLMYLDLHLHRLVLSTLEQGPWLSQQQVASTREVGLLRLLDGWAFAAAGAFVQATRFDPLHQAQTEQQLFDRLPAWLAAADGHAQLNLSVEHNDSAVEARAPSKIFLEAAAPIYRRMAEFVAARLPAGESVALTLSPRLAALPGVVAELKQLPEVSVHSGARLDFASVIQRLYLPRDAGRSGDGNGAVNVTRIPWFKAEQQDTHQTRGAGQDGAQPTHLLHGHLAHRLSRTDSFWVGTSVDPSEGLRLAAAETGVTPRHIRLRILDGALTLEDLSGGATRVNGQAMEGRRVLSVGDRVSMGDGTHELTLIAEANVTVKQSSASS